MQIFYFTHSRTIEWIRSRFHCQITHWNKVEILFSFACRAFYEHSFWHWNMCACVAAASNRLFWFASFLFLCDLHLVCLSSRERESERSHSQAIQHKRIYLYTFHLTVKCPEHKKKKKIFHTFCSARIHKTNNSPENCEPVKNWRIQREKLLHTRWSSATDVTEKKEAKSYINIVRKNRKIIIFTQRALAPHVHFRAIPNFNCLYVPFAVWCGGSGGSMCFIHFIVRIGFVWVRQYSKCTDRLHMCSGNRCGVCIVAACISCDRLLWR